MISLEHRISELERALSAADRKINNLNSVVIEMISSLKGLADSSNCKDNYCGQMLQDLQNKMN